jgi:hypothetical protein
MLGYSEYHHQHRDPQYKVILDHTYSPTACFKTVVDSAGYDAKAYMRKLELNEVEGGRATDARQVFNVLREKMPQPRPRNEENCSTTTFTSRTHVLLVDKADALPSDHTDDYVIIADQEGEQLDCKAIAGIQSIYNIQSRPESATGSPPSVWFRPHPCACPACQRR